MDTPKPGNARGTRSSSPTERKRKWHDINFKVPLAFRIEFKQRAARHNMSMVQLLYASYWHWVETNDPDFPTMHRLHESNN